jgi:CubicO group peptidase (beta-lactamase class C family)
MTGTTLVLAAALALAAVPVGAQTAVRADWAVAPLSDSGLVPGKLEALAGDIRAGKFTKIGSVLLARHGKLVYEEYFDGGAATPRDTRSATKSVTDILIGIAIDEHRLSGVDARVLELLPERKLKLQNPDPRKDGITVEDLLTMSSPLECDDWNDASRGNEERMYLVEDWAQFVLDLPIRGRMYLGERPPPPAFGRYFSYCTGGVFVLSEVLGRATATRTDHFAQSGLFAALDIRDAEWTYSPQGVPQT